MNLPGILSAWRQRWVPPGMALSTERRRAALFSCMGILLLGLFLTVMGAMWIRMEADREGHLNFERYADKLDASVAQRFNRVLAAYQGLRGYFHASQAPVNRDAFRIWVASRRIQEDMNGIRGIGFIQRVDRPALNDFIEVERNDGAPGFSVRTSGDALDLFVIKYIEPLANNEKAWGFDVGSETVRRQAAERAVRSGQSALTASVVLVQDGKKRPGYLYFLPVFNWATKIDTPQDRQRNLVGLIYSPIVLEEFLSGIGDVADQQLDLTVFDGDDLASKQQVFSLGLNANRAQQTPSLLGLRTPKFQIHRRLEIGGHSLTLLIGSTREFERRFESATVGWFALSGCLLSCMLAVTAWLLLVGRARAEALAQAMTSDLSAAKQKAELALRDNSTLLDTLQRFNLMSVTDAKGIVVDVNESFCLVSGYAREEIVGRGHNVMSSGNHDREFWREMWQTISGGEPWDGEVCNRAKDGSLYWVKTTVVPLKDAQGRVERYLSIRTDITDAKRNQQNMADMAERYQLAIDGGSDGLWDWFNVNDHKMWWSPQLYRMLGYAPDEFPAGLDAFEDLLHPDYKRKVLGTIEGALRRTTALDMTYPLRTRSGAYRWVRCRGKTFFDDNGFATRMAGSVQDIHDRHLAEEVIQKHSEQLSAIFSLSPDGFVSFGADGQVNYASAAYSELTGLSAETVLCLDEAEFLAQLFARCTHPPELRSLDELMACPSQADSMSWMSRHRLVLQMKSPAGRMLALSVYETQGDTVSRLLLVRDVTHEAEVDRMKNVFLSMAAHELRTPMASIYGFIELMLTRDLKPEKQKDLLSKVYRQCEVMISIINELLDLARIESQRGADFECRQLDLLELVDGVVGDFKTPADRDAPIMERPQEAMLVSADQQKMCQAFLNVLSNAYKYSPQGGPVQVSFPTSIDDDGNHWAGVRVVDHGIGMTQDQLAHMGERFFRADKSGNIPGTGLGVSIVKEIMELMGGRLDVSSELGKGTTMTLWLPKEAYPQTLMLA
ncbi:MAG: CHASE domain-containing protein [Aquabacterium sp.]|uniref:CHASE domain-containing protein n=1 Tax=Aquabacterium sp. TaxID=1872578 RepID=UPI0025C1456C|nr:CHASE domain-containing protein [Aquabacterium sp.]MBI5926040.1 CHASE domain-containing protein [Aquabacterium sp.]